MKHGDVAGCAVVLNDMRVIDGEIGRPLVEICHRVTSSSHQGCQRIIRFIDGCLRIVDKLGLDLPPTCVELLAFRRVEIADLELLDTLLSFGQHRLRRAFRSTLAHRSFVLGSKAFPQGRLSTLHHYDRDDGDRNDNCDDHSNYFGIYVHGDLLFDIPIVTESLSLEGMLESAVVPAVVLLRVAAKEKREE
jgi:hypothetical protein